MQFISKSLHGQFPPNLMFLWRQITEYNVIRQNTKLLKTEREQYKQYDPNISTIINTTFLLSHKMPLYNTVFTENMSNTDKNLLVNNFKTIIFIFS